ncbi:hypothetical protein NP493_109g03018 [Ridgeia piscesae]|uniref:TRPM SLOG domain-containing protein n=1 Tax=Ridgeia piscesae TaxID=27915 RepID=A0AAD9UH41_RIDPI|nr:hypothetical protein NP493_109g03018 [Ridgeia piscesae]
MDKVIDRVMKPLKKKWNMVVPNVVISVTGGADKTPMDPRVNEMLSRLVEVAHNTGTWIITGGTQAGVMRLVGEAVHDRLVADGSKTGLVAIGIATWGCVKGKDKLFNHDVSIAI